MDTATDHLGGLPALLAVLGGSPTGDEVATALVEGPGRHFDAAVCSILVREPDEMYVVGRHGYTGTTPQARFPVWGDLPVAQAVREGTVVVCDTGQAEDEFAELGPAWRHTPELAGRATIVCAPITARGISLGGYFLACDSRPTWNSLAFGLLEGVGRSLAMWLEREGLIPAVPSPDAAPEVPDLTPRQVALLRMLAAGRTTAAMAAALGCSVSTVKADLQRIGRLIGISERTALVGRAVELGLLDADAGQGAP